MALRNKCSGLQEMFRNINRGPEVTYLSGSYRTEGFRDDEANLDFAYYRNSNGVDQVSIALLDGNHAAEDLWIERVHNESGEVVRGWTIVSRSHAAGTTDEFKIPLPPPIAGPFPTFRGALAHWRLMVADIAPTSLPGETSR